MVDLMYCLTNSLFFDIPLLYYYINLRSLIMSCLFWRYISSFLVFHYQIYIFSVSISTVSELFFNELLDVFLVLLAILLPVKSPVASAVF